jgi:hypothetical protein
MVSRPKPPAVGAVRLVPWTGVYGFTARPGSPWLQAGLNAYSEPAETILHGLYPTPWDHERSYRAPVRLAAGSAPGAGGR